VNAAAERAPAWWPRAHFLLHLRRLRLHRTSALERLRLRVEARCLLAISIQ
jgi:hypothetical protein